MKPHRSHFVRTLGHFGQYEAPQATLCPNLEALQTIRSRTGHTLSELGGTSDNTKPYRRAFVRTWRHFRQYEAAQATLCPNLEALQTKQSHTGKLLSKLGQKRKREPIQLSSSIHFPIFFWRDSFCFAEHSCKLFGIFVANHLADFKNFKVRFFQQLFCIFYPDHF
jgi:hypothetical protein